MLLSLLAACTSGNGGGSGGGDTGAVADYTLRLSPVVAENQAPFDGIDRLDLVFQPAVGDAQRVSLGAPESGQTLPAEGLPALDETVIDVEGYSGGKLVSWGRTAPLSGTTGIINARVYVATTGEVGWLSPLNDGATAGIIGALGDGRFLIGGGLTSPGSKKKLTKSLDSLYMLDLTNPTADASVEDAGGMPEYTDAAGNTTSERMGASFTELKSGDHAGSWLLAGGSSKAGYDDGTTVTPDAQYYDPSDGSWSSVDNADKLMTARTEHIAMANDQGAVVVWGGWAAVDVGYVGQVTTAEIFRASDSAFVAVDSFDDIGGIDAAMADLGGDGTLLCGGATVAGLDGDDTADWRSESACHVITLTGEVGRGTFSGLPALAGLAMTTLSDGTVVATGGANNEAILGLGDTTDAERGIWTLAPGSTTWKGSGLMVLPRAQHRMVALDDHRAIVFGGGPTYGPSRYPTSAYSCVEIIDIDADSTMLNGCDSDADAGGLPYRMAAPMVALDNRFGILVVGGVTKGGTGATAGEAQPGLALFVPSDE